MIYFFDTPFLPLLYLFFAIMVLLLWKKPYLSLVGACGAGLYAVYLDRVSLLGYGLSLALFGAIYVYYKRPLPSVPKLALGLLITAVSCLFYLHFVPGFNNWLMIDQYPVSQNGWPYNLYLNINKIMVGIALIAFGQKLNQSWAEWRLSFRYATTSFFMLLVVLSGASLILSFVSFDPKLSPILWLWVPTNVLFVCVTEEVLFRGFIQKELSRLMTNVKGGQLFSLLIASVAFGLYHYKGGPYYIALATIAGVGYGYAFLKSKKLEGSIMTHFFVNLFHMLLFTYPALK